MYSLWNAPSQIEMKDLKLKWMILWRMQSGIYVEVKDFIFCVLNIGWILLQSIKILWYRDKDIKINIFINIADALVERII